MAAMEAFQWPGHFNKTTCSSGEQCVMDNNMCLHSPIVVKKFAGNSFCDSLPIVSAILAAPSQNYESML